jgi:outer membrane protein TolC
MAAEPSRSLTLTGVIASWMGRSDEVAAAQAELKRRRAQLTATTGVVTRLAFTPGHEWSRTQGDWAGRWRLGASVKQTTPWGLSGEIGTSWNPNQPSSQDLTASLVQDLGADRLGRRSRMLREAASDRVAAGEAEARQTKLLTCSAAAEAYIKTWQAFQLLDVSREMRQQSQKTVDRLESQLRRRLVRSLDVLSARADLASASDRLRQAEFRLSRAVSLLGLGLGQALEPLKTIELADPSEALAPLVSRLLNGPAQWPALAEAALAKQSLALQAETRAAQTELAWPAQLRLKAQRHSDLNLSQPGDLVALDLILEWPIRDPSREAQTVASLAQLEAEQRRLEISRRRLLGEISDSRHLLSSSADRLAIAESRLTTLRDQAAEALRLVEAARLEIDLYLRIRDSLFQAMVERLDLKVQIWSAALSLMAQREPEEAICSTAL